MAERIYAPRYGSFPADAMPAVGSEGSVEIQESEDSRPIVTWGILSACLGFWAAVGIVLWVPLVAVAMLRFVIDLVRSMMSGDRPDEAGRTLRDAVGFYRRGFSVAVSAVFGTDEDKQRQGSQRRVQQQKRARWTTRRIAFDVMWIFAFWYIVMHLAAGMGPSPVDGWRAISELPWGSLWGSVEERIAGMCCY